MDSLLDGDLSDDKAPTGKTLERYRMCYDVFIKWHESNAMAGFDEDVLLAYFNDVAKTNKFSTLMSMYSMLKRTLSKRHSIDIGSYSRLMDAIKEHSVGYERAKPKVFTVEEINRFMVEAPDEHYLAMKAIMVFGVAGGFRCEELQNVKIDHVKDCGTEIIVTAPRNRRTVPEMFLISGEFAKVVQKYMQRRPVKVTTDRFFLQYSQGGCENQVIGRNRFGIVPKEIAKFLKLDDYKAYTGHSFQPTNFFKRNRRWEEAKVVEAKLQRFQSCKNAPQTTKQISAVTKPDPLKRRAAATKAGALIRLTASDHSSTYMENVIIKSEFGETTAPADDIFYEFTAVHPPKTETNYEPIVPMLPATTALMKRRSKYYLGLQPNQFLQLMQLVGERKLISDVKLLLTLRKLRLNEEFDVLADAFDLERATAERYYQESKHAVIDLVDGLATAKTSATSNNFTAFVEPIIKIETSESMYVPDPIAVEAFNDSDSEPNADDQDDFEINLPEISTDEDRGFLSHDIRRRTAECTVCHKLFVPRLLNSHMDNVHFNLANLNRTICGLCWQEFETERLLKSHQKDAHGGGSCACDICGKTFASKRYISAHILTRHAQVKTYLCDTCGEGFPVPYLLLDHNKRKHNEPGHPCHMCEMKFMTGLSLRDHIVARHTNERPYKCQVRGCGKTFSWPSSYKSHRRVHLGDDKFECSICLKRFSFKGNLRNHIKTIHNQIVDNQCLSKCN
ncbi:uncharacterized protein LOC119074189 [Bradysia coprophila]|uniref:uncharacterized protein LOC119074189 n=1 Tax=Bradysia coprophila TaxID=38358 RepID=UPI00187D9A2F|nr:uncharacterized protein LOC119074189 [Bradysia coprophila]